jgi:peptide-methionine (R)-S-oxide reductase
MASTSRVLLMLLLVQEARPSLAFIGPSSSCSTRFITNRQHTPSSLRAAVPKVEKTTEEWRDLLSPEAYRVLREEGTEPPNTSPLNDVKEDGVFRCAGCRSPLFVAAAKYDSGTGWPSFYAPIDGDAVELAVDYKLIAPRTEVHCRACGGHLGHVFDDGPRPTGKRYCMNGVAMEFVPIGNDLELTKDVMGRVEAAEGDAAKQVQEPVMAVLPGAAFDGVVAALFISSFVRQSSDGQLLGLAGGIGGIFQFVPLLIGAYYAASALQKLVSLAGLDDQQ